MAACAWEGTCLRPDAEAAVPHPRLPASRSSPARHKFPGSVNHGQRAPSLLQSAGTQSPSTGEHHA
eukprot:365299-Chlamydomonas_euryale.AAC.2